MAPQTISLTDRLVLAAAGTKLLEPAARRALVHATRLLGVVLAHRLIDLRNSDDPITKVQGAIEEQTALVSLQSEIVELLGSRWDKIPDRERPHYTPAQRFRILRVKQLLGLSTDEAAHVFRVAPGTIARWQAELTRHPDTHTVGTTVRPVPPVRRYADVVAHTVQTMALAGFEGCGEIAHTLARAGWRVSRTSVRRYLKRRPLTAPPPEPVPSLRRLRARRPQDVMMADITTVRGLFGLQDFKVGAVLDVFSRLPLAVQVFLQEPSAEQMVALLRSAIERHGRPRHFVSDRGSQFTAAAFREALASRGIRQRFGAIGRTGSIAIIERFWRTLKDATRVRLMKPLRQEDLEQRLQSALLHYSAFRPHSALGRATPLEAYCVLPPAHLTAVHPPRGRPGEGPAESPFVIEHLDDERRFPILTRAA